MGAMKRLYMNTHEDQDLELATLSKIHDDYKKMAESLQRFMSERIAYLESEHIRLRELLFKKEN